MIDSSVNAFKNFATSTYDFFTDFKNYNLESFVDYIDDNLFKIGIMVGTVASLALLVVSAIGLLGASSAIMSTAMLVAGNISSIAGLTMGITGGLQVITGLNGTTLGGDELTNSERAGRLLSGTLNIFGGSGLMKTGIKLTVTDKNAVSKLANNVKESLFKGKNNVTKPEFYVGPDGTTAKSLSEYDWYTSNMGNPVEVTGYGNTGWNLLNNLTEQTAMYQVQSDPLENATQLPFKLGDIRWLDSEGWVKMQSVVETSNGKTIIHYVYNIIMGAFDDFKFK